MKGIRHPVSLKDIDKFVKQKPTISITVLGYGKKATTLLESVNLRIGIIT